MIVRDLLKSVFRICQVITSGEVLDNTTEEQDAFDALNMLLESWSVDNILIYNTVTNTFNIIQGKNRYSIGIGEDFDMERPSSISGGYLSFQGYDAPISIIQEPGYFSYRNKAVRSTPYSLYYDNSFPVGNIYLYPTPSANASITIASYVSLLKFSTVEDEINLPAAYERAIKYNLALDLAPEYNQELSLLVQAHAINSLKAVKTMSYKPMKTSVIDNALLSNNYYQDYFYTGN
jgi:hypothetical protein